MKKRYVIILVLSFFVLSLVLGGFIGVSLMKSYNKEDTKTESVKKIKSSRSLSMMLETGSNTGVYEQTTRSTWPTDGYLFNEELSKCENGGKLSWNDENSTVVMSGSTSDKCYVYFDVYNLAVINSLTEETTKTSIKLTVNATAGTKPITKYYYSKDNGTSYTESTSNTYTFSGLTANTTYNIKVYAVDEKGKSSEVYSKSVKTDISFFHETCSGNTLACYIAKKYTGTQSSNGIYLHNSSLTNGAGDNSYRYAGANPNNYVCFGSTASTCPNDNLYRIIGVFGDQVKLIKADYANSNLLGITGAYNTLNTYSASSYSNYKGSLTTINRYYWNSSDNESNVWSGSALNTTNLNGTYLTNLGTTWSQKIATTTWKVGGNTWANIVTSAMNEVYQNEIVSPAVNTTYNAKIGLMYVSDYGYAASPTYWTYLNYDSNGSWNSDYTVWSGNDYIKAINDNWMYMGITEWTISRSSDTSSYAFALDSIGAVDSRRVGNGDGARGDIYAVRPVFYLNSNVTYSSGTGTSSSPIRVN